MAGLYVSAASSARISATEGFTTLKRAQTAHYGCDGEFRMDQFRSY
jgi:hypothetical protein